MRLSDGTHLGYCTNIHVGESWAEVRRILYREIPRVRRRLGRSGPFGVGLRLAAAAADTLSEDATAFAQLTCILAEHDLYVFTINGFPHGAFHATRVKENVYRPDWGEPERLRYSNRLADLLVRLLPEGGIGSISTVPGAFKPRAATADAVDAIAHGLIRHAAHLVRLQRETGRTVVLALEPEPCCLLETVDETVAFFQDRLFVAAAVELMVAETGLDAASAEMALRRHLGVCLDACHAAVEFEDPLTAVDRLQAAGIPIAKLQLSCGLAVTPVTPERVAALAAFGDSVYLHQVVERRGKKNRADLVRFLDLPDALAAFDPTIARGTGAGGIEGGEWRVHFHVPIFRAELPPFFSTQNFLAALLRRHRQQPIAPHLEVETYTWDLLPAAFRDDDTPTAIARELAWVLERLGQ
ncbi:MAG: metabolite traffic protein EboE [Rhodospirillales bacterium]